MRRAGFGLLLLPLALAACRRGPRVKELEPGVFRIVNAHGTFIFLNDDASARKAEAGIGVRMAAKPEGLQIMEAFPDAPAAAAGLKAGDVIESVDGKSSKGLALEDAVKKVRGRPGTSLSLAVRTPSGLKTLKVVRDERYLHFTEIPEGIIPRSLPQQSTGRPCPRSQEGCRFLINSDAVCYYSCVPEKD